MEEIHSHAEDWKGRTPSTTNRFVISTGTPGTVWFSLVSLFPPTYKNRPNGNRVDIMELLAGMKPAFLRFPGGNYLEGPNYDNRFNWKDTIGPIEQTADAHEPVALSFVGRHGAARVSRVGEDLNMEPILARLCRPAHRQRRTHSSPETR